MNSNKILKFAEIFYSLAKSEKLPENSDDLEIILQNLEKLETYNARKKYAEKNLKHLSSGSSRVVYLTPQKTVIKLAKNDKGIAQNKAETNPKIKSLFINKPLKFSKKYIWIETEFLDKISSKKFEKLTNFNFEEFGDSLRYGLKNISENKNIEKPNNFDKISKSKIYKEIVELGKKFKLMPGDLTRISSWGIKNNKPVLADIGLTKNIFEEFYE